jgi:hypothetical protein
MTMGKRNQFSVGILFALVLMLFVSQVDAATGASANFQLDRKVSDRDLLQAARVEASHELADLKAELSRETQKRLASFTYEFDSSDVAPAESETRVASTVVNEDLAQTR